MWVPFLMVWLIANNFYGLGMISFGVWSKQRSKAHKHWFPNLCSFCVYFQADKAILGSFHVNCFNSWILVVCQIFCQMVKHWTSELVNIKGRYWFCGIENFQIIKAVIYRGRKICNWDLGSWVFKLIFKKQAVHRERFTAL